MAVVKLKNIVRIGVVIMCSLLYYVYIAKIGTLFAINYSKALGSGDIRKVDAYLDDNTLIVCNKNQKTYKELRDNVKLAVENGLVKITPGSSYGYASEFNVGGTQHIGIQSNIEGTEVVIDMVIRQKGLFKFSVESIESDSEFFNYLYFNVKPSEK